MSLTTQLRKTIVAAQALGLLLAVVGCGDIVVEQADVRLADIIDGTSNTLLNDRDQRDSNEPATGGATPTIPGAAGATGGQNPGGQNAGGGAGETSSQTPGGSPGAGGTTGGAGAGGATGGQTDGAAADDQGGQAAPTTAEQAQVIAELTTLLGNQRIEFGRSQGSGGSFVTTNSELVLCSAGFFGLLETTIFSSSTPDQFLDNSSEEVSNGTWAIRFVEGAFVIELTIQNSSDPNSPAVRRLAIGATQNGDLALDGITTRVSDGSGDCGVGAP